MVEPLAVTKRIPELEEDAGAGNTETDAPESTRKFLEKRVSLRSRREDEELAGRKKTFLPAGQLVFRPGAGLLTLLGLVSMYPVEPAGGGDGGWRPLMVRGSWGAGMAGAGGIG